MGLEQKQYHGKERQQNQFPMECTQHIFSYLPLKDCLAFASTSSTSLREVLPTIRLRRDYMTKKTYGVIVTSPKSTTSSYISHISKYNVQVGVIDDIQKDKDHKGFGNISFGNNTNIDNSIVFEFPTLPQRVAQLAVRMPCTHPMFTSVMQLNQVLAIASGQYRNHESEDGNDENDVNGATFYFIQLLKRYIRPLKLHAEILNNTVLSNHCYDSNTTTLHNYIGDVLCVTYLLYDFDCPMYAEHSITVQWLTNKLRLYSPTCYQSWILIHASILRTKSFTPKQRTRLGLSLPATPSKATSGCFQYIDSIYEQLNVDGIIQTSKLLFGWWHAAGILQIRTDQFVKSEMCIIYDDFGPLGPNNSFRGRDIVRVRDIAADTMTECLLLHQPTSVNTISNTNSALNSLTREAIEWICIVHEQAYKSRPMSVRIPMIRFN